MIKIILKTGKKSNSCIVMDQVIKVQENNLFFIKIQEYISEGITLQSKFYNNYKKHINYFHKQLM